ncbi:hypothetical protein B0T20DRAFT_220521 [Sordaria brevicollis]|uniref:Uncharacterized protein n=1 Tax=Sordaria brevicollis TaxID=83679 RepID=A0AAE0PCS0_SORBR|nr:hypothetical protein B0T20DRAFT_220521 [Sordaria brevicollis]
MVKKNGRPPSSHRFLHSARSNTIVYLTIPGLSTYTRKMYCQPSLHVSTDVKDVILDPTLLIIVVPHVVLMAGIYLVLMPRNIPLKSKPPGDSPSVPPPALPKEPEDTEAQVDPTTTWVLFAQVVSQCAETIGLARPSLPRMMMTLCLSCLLYDTRCSRIHEMPVIDSLLMCCFLGSVA